MVRWSIGRPRCRKKRGTKQLGESARESPTETPHLRHILVVVVFTTTLSTLVHVARNLLNIEIPISGEDIMIVVKFASFEYLIKLGGAARSPHAEVLSVNSHKELNVVKNSTLRKTIAVLCCWETIVGLPSAPALRDHTLRLLSSAGIVGTIDEMIECFERWSNRGGFASVR